MVASVGSHSLIHRRRIVLLALAGGALLGGLAVGTLLRPPPETSKSVASDEPEAVRASNDMDGEFELINQNGERTRLTDLRGRALLLFFGYTHCPDICPATLMNMRQVKQNLGADAARFQGVSSPSIRCGIHRSDCATTLVISTRASSR